jgi:hypothetical protein
MAYYLTFYTSLLEGDELGWAHIGGREGCKLGKVELGFYTS